jgi:PhzF family phenazine biosynthesis protein
MSQPIVQIDAFTDQPFAGNPAAVCLMSGPADERWMQRVASEVNLAETAFLYPQESGYHLRWFTPAAEVALCGHATLATAHLLWQDGHAKADAVLSFSTRSGELRARKRGEWIELDFPARPVDPVTPPAGLLEALGVTAVFVGKSTYDYLVEVESSDTVRGLKPNLSVLTQLSVRGAIVTARSSNTQFDFISRFFAPGVGVPEDPVTGSAHCTLGPYWQSKLGKSEFVAWQASPRGGMVRVRVMNDRVFLGGKAVTVFRGELV